MFYNKDDLAPEVFVRKIDSGKHLFYILVTYNFVSKGYFVSAWFVAEHVLKYGYFQLLTL